MQLHQLKRKNPNEKHVQVGRGGKRGKTSGRGTKGQNARAGNKKYPELRVIIKKLPKLRGYKFNTFQTKAVVVNLATLGASFEKNDQVTPESLRAKKLVSYPKGSKPVVKILATGEITIPLLISGCKVSKQAQDKIVAAGGAVK